MKSRLAELDFSIIGAARDRINWTIMPGDHMFSQNKLHYEEVGESALRCIIASITLANSGRPDTILDFGCGSGRVLRWIRAAFPNAKVDISDIREDALAFCSREFDAHAWRSNSDLESLKAPRSYDLIWSGSVLTHLSERACQTLLKKFRDWLNPGGIIVATTHGRRALSNQVKGRLRYAPSDRNLFLAESLKDSGYAFVPFAASPELGNSFMRPGWILSEVDKGAFRLVVLSEAAWDKHQDVIALQRLEPAFEFEGTLTS